MNSNILSIINKLICDEPFTNENICRYRIKCRFLYIDNFTFVYACKYNNLPLINKLVYKCSVEYGLMGACMGGHIELIKRLIDEFGAKDIISGLCYASKFGHIDAIEFLMPLVPSLGKKINWLLYYACEQNQIKVIQLLVEKYKADNYAYGLAGAANGGKITASEIMLKLHPLETNSAVFTAFCCGNEEYARWLIKAVSKVNWNEALSGACEGNHLHMIKLISELCDDMIYCDYALFGACNGGHLELAKTIVNSPESLFKDFIKATNWNMALICACAAGHSELAEFAIENGATDMNSALYNACKNNRPSVAMMMSFKANVNYGLRGACESANIELIDMMIKKGANDCAYCNNINHHFLM